jgi:hypothetical protein
VTLNRREFIAAGATALALPAFAQEEGFEVHEWGVVTIAYGTSRGFVRSEGSRFVDGVEKPEELPAFVETLQKRFDTAIEHWHSMPVRKPIVYFHARKRMTIAVKVAMPKGRPHAWWPRADDVAPKPTLPPKRGFGSDPADKLPVFQDLPMTDGLLSWTALTLDPTATQFAAAAGWWPIARETASTPVLSGALADKFLFYDALTTVDPAVDVTWTAAGNANLSARAAVTVFAIHVKEGACFSASAALAKGASAELVLAKGRPDLAKPLTAAGLCADEAASLIKIWTDEFFETPGARVLVLLPRAAYDALLPLEITPKPTALTRVLIAHLECLDPATQAKVDAWIAKLGSESIDERDAATAGIRSLGPLAEKSVRDAIEQSKDAEVRSRLQELLKK